MHKSREARLLKLVLLTEFMTKAIARHSRYYEAILQLRNPSEELLNWLKSTIDSEGRAAVTKEHWFKNGVDLYITNQKYTRSLGKRLQDKFGGELKSTRTLHTVDHSSGKRLYRVTVYFRQFGMKKGELFSHKGKEYVVIAVSKTVFAKEVESGRKRHFRMSEIP